jgi:hypothetical protein
LSNVREKRMFYTHAGIIREMLRAMHGGEIPDGDGQQECCMCCVGGCDECGCEEEGDECVCCTCDPCECREDYGECNCCDCGDYCVEEYEEEYDDYDYDYADEEYDDEKWEFYRLRTPTIESPVSFLHEGHSLNVATMIHIGQKYLPEREGVHHDDRDDLLSQLYYGDVETVDDLKALFEGCLEAALAYEAQLCLQVRTAYEEGGMEEVDRYVSYSIEEDDLQRILNEGKYFTRAGIIREMLEINENVEYDSIDYEYNDLAPAIEVVPI